MFLNVSLYDLFVVCFVQLVLSLGLMLSPARRLRIRWTGSRVTEVIVGTLGAVVMSALACLIAAELWNLPAVPLETAAFLLTMVSVIGILIRPDWNIVGQVFAASFASSGFTIIVFAALVAVVAAHTAPEAVTSACLLLLDLGALLVWNSFVVATSDVLCRARPSRSSPVADPEFLPMVSLHIPAYNEPPHLLIETISALERLDYPNFEIVVIDNNTPDATIYGPVQEYCRDRERVRFVHVAPWPGFKAGACNLALRRYTDPRAEIVGIVDADDLVQPHYLRETVGYFSDPTVGFLQTFEGNRDFQGSSYYSAVVDSYQSFYLTNMSTRNERNSIPFVGTMGLLRRGALEDLGGWNEWCIAEDTEASLRLLKAGWSGLYVPRCFGRGVVPPSFVALNKQRHRWCFGAVQILRLHWRSLRPWDHSPDNHLTGKQRMDYLAACLGWFKDLICLAFAIVLLVTTGLLLSGSGVILQPFGGDAALLPLLLVIIASVSMTFALIEWTPISPRRTLLGLIVSLSMTWTVALACIEGMTRREGVFLRTAKGAGLTRGRAPAALWNTRWEILLSVALYVSAGLLAASAHPPGLLIFVIVTQATLFVCAPITSLWNLAAERVPPDERQRRHNERLRRSSTRRRSVSAAGVASAMVPALAVGALATAFLAPAHLQSASGSPLRHSTAPAPGRVVDIAPVGGTGWLSITARGIVYAIGAAHFEGDLFDMPGGGDPVHVSDIVAVAPTPDGRGYWLAAANGRVFAFGDAGYRGSIPDRGVQVHDVVGITSTPSGDGYYLVGSNGSVYPLGRGARYEGSLRGSGGGFSDIVGMILSPDGKGYWLVAAHGRLLYAFGDAKRLPGPTAPADALRAAALDGTSSQAPAGGV